ncbi:LysR family transcriptional regulator [Knoellia subterranea]|uniref:Transcriptional regulator n=1 Tax=Knoellia subterranea KCTC 19937 TaxID=1385521 RepID=A0A0A0JK78_9MICO|nr:LysR family transcriptional regulator [Knoellia subterranea]KGN37174.1 transcriptional regulator [Knoellia subterranea KCTC 19937]
MDVRHLSLLRELSERGSVAAVAAATHRTGSAVSQQLRTAERELGIALVEPAGRGIRLTDAGRLLAAGALEVETALARVEARLDEFRGRPSGRVRIAGLTSATEFLVPPTLARLATEGIEVELTDTDVSEADYAMLAADHDIVIGHSLLSAVPAGSESLVRTVLAREALDVALRADHPLAGREELGPRDVVDEPWVGVPPGYPFETVHQSIERVTGRPVRIVQHIRDNRVAEALVEGGAGLALLPRHTTRPREGVVLRPLRGVNARRWIVAMSRPDRAERAVVRRTVAALRHVGRTPTAPTFAPHVGR